MWHRRIKSLHGWLGLMVWPWVLMIALSGLYQNHRDAIDALLPGRPMTAERLALVPAAPVTRAEAGARLGEVEPVTVFGHPGWQVKGASRGIDALTGVNWDGGRYLTLWRAADGAVIGWRMDWQRLFLQLHRAGWAGGGLGTWPADLVALALSVFALSGLWLFLAPRLRAWARRR